MHKKTAPHKPFFSDLILSAGFALFYLVSHFAQLLSLPVFADESIYIRWAQLIMDDPHRYLFFALNDGKTPLFIWLMIPFQYLFHNQLFAARFVSVMIGLLQMFLIKELVKSFGGKRTTQYLGMFLTATLPFWFFHHRMALMDGMMTLLLSMTILGLHHTQLSWKQQPKITKHLLMWIGFTGLSYGMAFWTKLPALFLLPAFPVFALQLPQKNLRAYIMPLFLSGVAAATGLTIFAFMRISPAFGQLFHRGQDFTYPIGEVLFHGRWRTTLGQLPTYINFIGHYITWPVLFLSMVGVFSTRFRRTTIVLLLSAILFAVPFSLFGKVVYARYFMPVAVFLTVSSVLSLQGLHQRYIESSSQNLNTKFFASLMLASLVGLIVTQSLTFDTFAVFAPSLMPLVESDKSQYLEDWSSGHGITETVAYIQQQAQTRSIAVATEGRFGTLPDGLLLYFHNQNVQNIYIEGTGQYPVKSIPDFFSQKAKKFDQIILLVNSDRMELHLDDKALLHQYCRPNNAPCLQIWDITDIVKK